MKIKDKKIIAEFKKMFTKLVKDHKDNGGCRLLDCNCAYCIIDDLTEIFNKIESKDI